MREFPDITIADPNYMLWLWVIIPAVLALLFLIVERVIERFTEKRWNKPVVGVGYILMGISLLVGAMAVTLVPPALNAERNLNAATSLEQLGFQDVRISIDKGTFGAVYEGDLMRGVVIEDQQRSGYYNVYETPIPGIENLD